MTVTRVPMHPDQVLPGTRARVQQALARLGYLPDRAAGGLATRRGGFVGLVLPTLATAPRDAGMPTDLVRAEADIPLSCRQGAAAMGALLDAAADVDGVFAVSELSAVGAPMECRRRGIDVPQRLSLIGFGDFEIGQQMVPPLTTVGVDFPDLGRGAGAMVIDLLRRGISGQDDRIDVGFTLIVRGTTRVAALLDNRGGIASLAH